MEDQNFAASIVIAACSTESKIKFSLRRSDGETPYILFVFIADAETGQPMWHLSIAGTGQFSGQVISLSSPRPLEPGSEEAAEARVAFERGMSAIAIAHGIPLLELTYGVVPPGLKERHAALPLQKGHAYTIAVSGFGMGGITFDA
jgi:hypothetical protein